MATPRQAPYGGGRLPPSETGNCCVSVLRDPQRRAHPHRRSVAPKLARRLARRYAATFGRPLPVFA